MPLSSSSTASRHRVQEAMLRCDVVRRPVGSHAARSMVGLPAPEAPAASSAFHALLLRERLHVWTTQECKCSQPHAPNFQHNCCDMRAVYSGRIHCLLKRQEIAARLHPWCAYSTIHCDPFCTCKVSCASRTIGLSEAWGIGGCFCHGDGRGCQEVASVVAHMVYRFHHYTLDPAGRELWHGPQRRKARSQRPSVIP